MKTGGYKNKFWYGMDVITIKLDSVEFYNTQTQKWEMTNIKLIALVF